MIILKKMFLKKMKDYWINIYKNIDSIVDTLLKISELVTKNEEIYEMDLNPVFIYQKGLICVDARIILKKKE